MTDLLIDEVRITRQDGSTVTFGDVHDWCVEDLTAHGLADIREGDQDAMSGEIGGMDSEGGRPIILTVTPKLGMSDADAIESFEEFSAIVAVSHEDVLFEFNTDGVIRAYFVRPRGVSGTVNSFHQDALITINLRALDPRSYGDAVVEDLDGDGLTIEYGGQRPTYGWVFTVEGPCVHPVLVATLSNDLGTTFQVLMPGETIATGERLELDARLDEIRIIGTDGLPRYQFNAIGSTGRPAVLWPLPPVSAFVQFSCASGTDTGSMSVRPSY